MDSHSALDLTGAVRKNSAYDARLSAKQSSEKAAKQLSAGVFTDVARGVLSDLTEDRYAGAHQLLLLLLAEPLGGGSFALCLFLGTALFLLLHFGKLLFQFGLLGFELRLFCGGCRFCGLLLLGFGDL